MAEQGRSLHAVADSSGWEEYVNAEIARYKKNYNSIILVGHSMGSLLSFLTYMESPEQIIGIVAIDTPLYVRVKGRALRNNLKVGFCKEIPESDLLMLYWRRVV